MSTDIANKILELCKDQKFKAIIIISERNIGMSTYAMKLMSEVYSRD